MDAQRPSSWAALQYMPTPPAGRWKSPLQNPEVVHHKRQNSGTLSPWTRSSFGALDGASLLSNAPWKIPGTDTRLRVVLLSLSIDENQGHSSWCD